MVAVYSTYADPVAKVTVLPAGQSLGVTQQLPTDERHLYAESYLLDSLAVRLGGRAAEILVLGEASTGAANDLGGATELATRMVRDWGFSSDWDRSGSAREDRRTWVLSSRKAGRTQKGPNSSSTRKWAESCPKPPSELGPFCQMTEAPWMRSSRCSLRKRRSAVTDLSRSSAGHGGLFRRCARSVDPLL